MATPYGNGAAHLLDELGWVRALVAEHLERVGLKPPEEASEADQVGRYAITPEEAAGLLRAPAAAGLPGPSAELRRAIDARLQASQAAGQLPPLLDLAQRFGLDATARQLLVVLAAPELDVSLERLYAYAWNDFTRKRPDVGFVCGLLEPDLDRRWQLGQAFGWSAPLVAQGLALVESSHEGREHAWAARPVKLADRVVAHLLGDSTLDRKLSLLARAELPQPAPQLVFAGLYGEASDKLLQLASAPSGPRLVLVGPVGCGKLSLARKAVHGRGRQLLVVDGAQLVGEASAHPTTFEDRLLALRREVTLTGAGVYVDFTRFESEGPVAPAVASRLGAALQALPTFVAVGALEVLPWLTGALSNAVVSTVPATTPAIRETLWRAAFARALPDLDAATFADVAARYPLTPGSVERAAAAAAARMRQRGPEARLSSDDLIEACRSELTPRLAGYAQRILTHFTWQDIILPEHISARLREMIAFARHRRFVFEQWGFDAKLPYGRGLSALFSGPPGTGKTMVASIIAAELGMELFRVDLSRIVSKYVGETEKNLSRIFDEAQRSHSVLLFDEADSLFAKRTEVQSSVDRYANLEVNYLLQRMEDFDGVTVLTTNFESSIDEAFRRRIRFKAQFPFPDGETRGKLWESMIPAATPLEDDIDWEEIGDAYELSGGHIKNAVVRAAFLAASEGRHIGADDLHNAAIFECREIGLVVRDPREDD